LTLERARRTGKVVVAMVAIAKKKMAAEIIRGRKLYRMNVRVFN
jgi:hypothetical protein